MIRLATPAIDDSDISAVADVLRSGHLVQGSQVAAFEDGLSSELAGTSVVAVSSGTAALHTALQCLNIKPGDIVLVPSYSWPATANVVEVCGAQAVFVDILDTHFGIDPRHLEQVLDSLMTTPGTSRLVRAIIAVHAFGAMCDMAEVCEIAKRYDLPVIEDAACAIGATLHGRPAGTWGNIGCFSFHPRKVITTAEGGAICTNDPMIRDYARSFRDHGIRRDEGMPRFILPGLNYRMTEMEAALGRAQLKKLPHLLMERRRIAEIYDGLLQSSQIRPPARAQYRYDTYQSYVVLLPQAAAASRNEIIHIMQVKGVETTIGTWHIPGLDYYRQRYGYAQNDFRVSEGIFRRSLTLPTPTGLKPETQEFVVDALLASLAEI